MNYNSLHSEKNGWPAFFMRHVYLAASKSKDKSSRIGAVLVQDKTVISIGYNGLPRLVDDDVEERHKRPEKYHYFVHGECNSIYNAARNGIKTLGSDLYTNGLPCSNCAAAIIQAGIKTIILHQQWQDIWSKVMQEKWRDCDRISNIMFKEAKINILSLNLFLGEKCLISEKEYEV